MTFSWFAFLPLSSPLLSSPLLSDGLHRISVSYGSGNRHDDAFVFSDERSSSPVTAFFLSFLLFFFVLLFLFFYCQVLAFLCKWFITDTKCARVCVCVCVCVRGILLLLRPNTCTHSTHHSKSRQLCDAITEHEMSKHTPTWCHYKCTLLIKSTVLLAYKINVIIIIFWREKKFQLLWVWSFLSIRVPCFGNR